MKDSICTEQDLSIQINMDILILNRHFHEANCKDTSYKVQILEKLGGSGRTSRNALGASWRSFRKQGEKNWMLKLRTVYPSIRWSISKQKTSQSRMSRGQQHKIITFSSPDDFISNFYWFLPRIFFLTNRFIRNLELGILK